MASFQILANDHFLFFLFEFEAIIFASFDIIYSIDVKTQVNRNFTTSTFQFLGYLDEP
jgi:hypothetical protein